MTTLTAAPSPLVERPGACAHPGVTDAQIIEGVEKAFRYWDSALSVQFCSDCGESLYPTADDPIVVHVGEPVE